MKRYKVTLLVPFEKEILAPDLKEAGEEGGRLAGLYNKSDDIKTIVRSVIELGDEPEPIDFGFVNGGVA